MSAISQIRISAVVMLIAIGLGAMGAHMLEDKLVANGHLPEWKTAALYQMIHGLAMFAVAIVGRRERMPFCFKAWLVGVILFSGSLYVMSLTGSKALPIVISTPLGGLALMIGWLALVIKPARIFENGD